MNLTIKVNKKTELLLVSNSADDSDGTFKLSALKKELMKPKSK